jgi:hypothetical protein
MIEDGFTSPQLESTLFVEAESLDDKTLASVMKILKMTRRPLRATADLFNRGVSRTQTGVTLILTNVSSRNARRFEDYATLVDNGGRICSLVIDQSTIYIGLPRSRGMSGGCPECLNIRIMQRMGTRMREVKYHPESSKNDASCERAFFVTSQLLNYELSSSDEPTAGRGLAIRTNPLRCDTIHVVKSDACGVCVKLRGR